MRFRTLTNFFVVCGPERGASELTDEEVQVGNGVHRGRVEFAHELAQLLTHFGARLEPE